MTEPITIELPKDHLDFEIGDSTYTASFADKSIAKYLSEYKSVEKQEVNNAQAVEKLQTKLGVKLEALNARRMAFSDDSIELPKGTSKLNEEGYVGEKQKLDREFMKKFNDLHAKQEEESKANYIGLLSQLFGTGKGDEVFNTCGKSTIVLAKVMTQIIKAIGEETDIMDYRQNLEAQIEELKEVGE